MSRAQLTAAAPSFMKTALQVRRRHHSLSASKSLARVKFERIYFLLADAGCAAAVRLEFLSGGVFANCDIVSTHIDASLLDALPPEYLAETLVVWNAREPFARLVSGGFCRLVLVSLLAYFV